MNTHALTKSFVAAAFGLLLGLAAASGQPEGSRNITLRWEAVSLPRALARPLLTKVRPAETYAETLKLLDGNPEVRLELLAWQKTRSGSKCSMESITEFPFPTDFDPPGIPRNFGKEPAPAPAEPAAPPNPNPPPPPAPPPPEPAKPPGNQGDTGPGVPAQAQAHAAPRLWPYHPSTPTTYESKPLGCSIEADATLSDNGEVVTLTAAPAIDSFLGWEWMDEPREIWQPNFQSQRVNFSRELGVGKTSLAGTFNRPEIGEPAPRTWLLFVTATLDIIPPTAKKTLSPDLRATMELISLPLADAHAIARKAGADAEIYAALEAALTTGAASLEELSALGLRSGQRVKSEADLDVSFPGDYDPPAIPDTYSPVPGLPPGDWPHSLLSPTTFETHPTGFSWEADPEFDPATGVLALTVTPERGRLREWQTIPGIKVCRNPIFDTQRLKASLTTALDHPTLLGTMSPSPGNTLKGGERNNPKKERVWFAFLTVRD